MRGHVPGVPLVAHIGGVDRFRDAQALTGHESLAPSVHPSGNTLYHRGITKEGPRPLWWSLVQAVGPTSRTTRELLKVACWVLREGGCITVKATDLRRFRARETADVASRATGPRQGPDYKFARMTQNNEFPGR